MSERKEIKALRILRLQGIDSAFARTKLALCDSMNIMGIPQEELAILEDLVDVISSPESIAEFKEIYAPAYVDRFSEEEMDQIIEILSNPIYQKFNNSQNDIVAENIKKTMEWTQNKISHIIKKYSDLDDGPIDNDEPPYS